MAANLRMASLALLLAGMGSVSAALAGLGPIHVLSSDGETFSAEIPVVNEDIRDFAQVNLADRNSYPLLSPYSGSAGMLQFSLVRGADGKLRKVMVRGPAAFAESLLRFAVEVGWPDGRLVREFEVDYKRDGPRRKTPAPAGEDGKSHAATPDQGSRLDGSALGDLRISSRLGEPLMAELPLLGSAFDKADQLQVSIYADTAQGGPVKDLLQQVASITHQLDRSIDGRRMLLLSSALPITVPHLAFRLEVSAGAVKAQKSYVLSMEGSPVAMAAKAEKAGKAEQEKPAEASKVYKVSKGDTLSGIAARMRGYERGQDVAAKLLKDNPDAFIHGDANKLLAGSDLRYPSHWKLHEASSAAKAAAPVEQAKPKESMAKLLAEGRQADQAGAAAKPAGNAPAPAKAQPKIESKAPPKAEPKTMSAPPAPAPTHAASSPAVLAAERKMRDTLQQQDKVLKETELRTRALEEKIRALQQQKPAASAPMKEKSAAAMPKPTAQPAAAEAMAKPTAASAAKAGDKSPEAAAPPAKAVASMANAIAAANQHQPQPAPAPSQPAQPLTPKPAAEGVMDDAIAVLTDKDVVIKLGGAAAALGLVALLLLRRKRQGRASEAPEDPSTIGVPTRPAMGPLASLMSSLKKEDGGIDLGTVDVMAEAEVYLAYGRADQAVVILRDGLDKEPMRQDLRFKLLEVLAAKPDKDEFLQEAVTAKGMLSPDSTLWQRICELGKAAVPGHPLFEAAAAQATDRPGVGVMEPIVAARAPEEGAELEMDLSPPAPAMAEARAPVAQAAPAVAASEVDQEKMELAKLYMEMGDKETAETLIREAQHGR
ncbi:type IV pilus assembly protein FimV [Chromobacterium paludis]|uniref:LysM domain-containing protein n=1 Tax=Chromobacterium paludis TaxID=2605945 RepID=A0A5C1DFS9_9NEIS|nr:hypothetical protein [Chromobacterium paludis]QEL55560.1 hypothetical protein FYK34_08240 [Chromobacterium paludis]